MSNSYWKWLNKQPAKFRAKTTPELKELGRILDHNYKEMEKENPPIGRSKEDVELLLEEDPMYNAICEPHVYATADGLVDFMDANRAKQIYRRVMAVRDKEYLGQMITVWRQTRWVQLKECYTEL
jgi:hypothetical protein